MSTQKRKHYPIIIKDRTGSTLFSSYLPQWTDSKGNDGTEHCRVDI